MKELISRLKRKQEYLHDYKKEYTALYINRTNLDCLLGILERLDGLDEETIDNEAEETYKYQKIPVLPEAAFKDGALWVLMQLDYIKGKEQ